MKRIYLLVSLLFLAFVSSFTFGNIGTETNKWLNDFNANTNVTPPQAIKGSGGYYLSAGSYVQRNKTGDVGKFVDLTPPRMSAGCGGVDAYFGGFSFIDAQEFVEMLKQVADNGTGLVFMMGIKLVSPMFSSTIEYIQGIVDKVNKFRQDSCAAATAMVGGIGEKLGKKNLTCELRRMNEMGDDWADAKKHCQKNSGNTTNNSSTTVDDKGKYDFISGNLTWQAMNRAGLGSLDKEYRFLLMNIVGTVIRFDKSSGTTDVAFQEREISPMFSLVGNAKKEWNDVLDLLVSGKSKVTLNIDVCVSSQLTDCLKLKTGGQKITSVSNGGLHQKINSLMAAIVLKMRNDQNFSNEEFALLGQFGLPIYPLLRYALAYERGHGIEGGVYTGYTKVLAEIIVIENILQVISEIEKAAHNMPDGIKNDKKVLAWLKQFEVTAAKINTIKQQKVEWQEKKNAAIEQILVYRQHVNSQITKNLVLASGWSR